jgi:Polyketide cyclase / dehydrase and lipid transport
MYDDRHSQPANVVPAWKDAVMPSSTRHLGERIARPADEVYEFVADPANLPRWSSGLGGSIHEVDGAWFIESPDGRIGFAFVEPNDLGVLDHRVTFPSGAFYNPMRVVPYDDGSEVTFSVRRYGDISDADFERDVAAVTTDLAKLKEVLEAGT